MQMSGRIRSKITYPHVVSTLALFLALGGSAYAISLGKNEVRSRNIAPKAVKTSDLAGDAATGAKVKESSLGQVPSALNADRAAGADLLGGLGPGAFERSTRIQFGQAPNNVITDQVLFSWPELGLQVLNDGDAVAADQEIRLRNTRPPGGDSIAYDFRGPAGASLVSPGSTSVPIATATSGSQSGVMVFDGGSAIRVMLLECGYGGPSGFLDRVFCFGVRSEP